MQAWLYPFIALVGVLNAVQPGTNAQLVRSLERPWLVGLLVSLVTSAAFLAGFLLTGARLPEPGRLAAAPWWVWTGGLCGAVYVTSTLFVAERLGSAAFTGLVITASVVASLLLDHFGLVGFRQHGISLLRLAGAGLMIAGMLLVARF